MSQEQDKFKHRKRLQQDENAVKKQLKIAKHHRVSEYNPGEVEQPHRFNKHHAMDCGNPGCYLCGNPRKTHKDKLTAQEKRLFQDLDTQTDKRSNGLKNDKEDIL